MRNIIIILLAGSFLIVGCSKKVSGPVIDPNQKGVKFMETSFAKVMSQAEKENKPVLIDFYTTWCVPCKWLDKDVFENETVGNFFNTNFINVKVDAEKGEGPQIASQYGVYGYPTLVYLDSKGNVVNQHVGMTSASHVMNMGQEAIDANSNLSGD